MMEWKTWFKRLRLKLSLRPSIHGMQINLISSQRESWFDRESNQHIDGVVYQYEVRDPQSGEWLVTVCTSESPKKAIVQATHKRYAGGVYDQIRRKTDVFLPCEEDPTNLYHPLGIAYLDKAGRLRYQRVSEEVEVPESIRTRYRLDVYERVAPYRKNRALQHKLVVLIPIDQPEEMAKFFILEKVRPLF